MATCEEQLFWREQLPSFYLQANSPTITKRLRAISYNGYTPIPITSSPPSPLVTLPVELLYKIYAFARYEFCGGHESPYVDYITSKNMIKLVQICRYWRALALSDPTLWATIVVTSSTPGAFQRVRLWLARTGTTCPLSLMLGTPLEARSTVNLMELFLTYLHRWSKIYFVFSPDSMSALQLLVQLPHGSAPQLKSICMESSRPDLLAETIHQAWASLGSTSSLRMASLENKYIPPVPWHQLTTLFVKTIPAQMVLDVLGHCQCLEYLYFSCPLAKGLPRCSFPVVLPSLRTLHLYAEMNTAPLLDCLTAPALVNLYINQTEWISLKPRPASLHDFLFRSQCSLKIFELIDYELSEVEFLQYIQSPLLSTATSVLLSGSLSDVVVAALTMGVSGSPLLPAIHQLKFHTSKASKDGLLEAMVLSRLQMRRLKLVELSIIRSVFPRDFVSDMYERFNVDIVVYGDW